jgi:hypothetical protein
MVTMCGVPTSFAGEVLPAFRAERRRSMRATRLACPTAHLCQVAAPAVR